MKMKIKYEEGMANFRCSTPCPYNEELNGMIRHVHSVSCTKKCKYYVKENEKEQYIICNHFNLKDKIEYFKELIKE